ncbi:uncharacterized protein LOC108677837 [Hyalella azteca]|uniref:Uncharacterized protein LOC108677837 n=1 Tax=Hyalella azteca TaxID=294128 RepID=A0A8B7P8W3_HYAAZ|nr:uncharacterized protein LOC108677837 [Hyalella azteca]
MIPSMDIKRRLGSVLPKKFQNEMVKFHFNQPVYITGETLMSTTMLNSNPSGPMNIVDPKANYVAAADLEEGKHRYLVSGRYDGSMAVHDLHTTTLQTISPISRTVFPCVVQMQNMKPNLHKKPVTRVQWYPGDYGHYSTSSRHENTVKLWDPNRECMTEEFKFENFTVADHAYSYHQPIIAVSIGGDVCIIDLRTGHIGQKMQRPKLTANKFRHSAQQPANEDAQSSGKIDLLPDISRFSSGRTASAWMANLDQQIEVMRSALQLRGASRNENNEAFLGFDRASTRSAYRTYRLGREQQKCKFLGADVELKSTCVRFHPAIPSVVTAGYSDGAVVLWDVRSSRSYICNIMDGLPEQSKRPTDSLVGIRYSHDGHHLVTYTARQVSVWDGLSGESKIARISFDQCPKLTSCGCNGINELQISTAASRAFMNIGPGIFVFDLISGAQLSRFRGGHMRSISGLVLDNSQHRIFSYGIDANFISWNFQSKEFSKTVKTKGIPADQPSERRWHEEDAWSSDED